MPSNHSLEVSFAPKVAGNLSAISGLQFDVERPRDGKLPAALRDGSGTNHRQHIWWNAPANTSMARWLVHPGNLKLSTTSRFQLMRAVRVGDPDPAGEEVSIDIADPVHRVTFRLPPPPTDSELEGTAK